MLEKLRSRGIPVLFQHGEIPISTISRARSDSSSSLALPHTSQEQSDQPKTSEGRGNVLDDHKENCKEYAPSSRVHNPELDPSEQSRILSFTGNELAQILSGPNPSTPRSVRGHTHIFNIDLSQNLNIHLHYHQHNHTTIINQAPAILPSHEPEVQVERARTPTPGISMDIRALSPIIVDEESMSFFSLSTSSDDRASSIIGTEESESFFSFTTTSDADLEVKIRVVSLIGTSESSDLSPSQAWQSQPEVVSATSSTTSDSGLQDIVPSTSITPAQVGSCLREHLPLSAVSTPYDQQGTSFQFAAESASAVTPRNRDAVYVNSIDSEEVRQELAALLLASGAVEISPSADAHDHSPELDVNNGRVTESYQTGYAHSRQEPSSSQTGLTAQPLSPDVHKRLPLSPVLTSYDQEGTSFAHGVGVGIGTSSLAFGLIGTPPKSTDDVEMKGKSLLAEGAKVKRGTDIENRNDASASKPLRQRLASIISRAMGSNNGSNGTKPASIAVSVPTATPATALPSSPVPFPDVNAGATRSSQGPMPAPRLRTASMPSIYPSPPLVSPTATPALPTSLSESTPSFPPQARMRSRSNATKPSPLPIGVLPYALQTAAPRTNSTPMTTTITSTSNPAPPHAITGGHSTSVTAGPARPLTLVPRIRPQASDMSHSSDSTTFSVADPTSASTSRSSVSLSIDDAADNDESSDGLELEEDDGAYYVKAFMRSYNRGRKQKRVPKPTPEQEDDGNITETDNVPRAAARKSMTFKRSSKHSELRSPFISKTPPIALPNSPPPSISPLSVLPVSISSSVDLPDHDSDPFTAAPSPTILSTPSSTSPSTPTSLQSYPYRLHPHSLQASKSMNTLPKIDVGNGSTPKAIHRKSRVRPSNIKSKSLMSPGDLPPSRAWQTQPEIVPSTSSTTSDPSLRTIVPKYHIPVSC
ncbi:hypothetical protein V5O48_015998 [Marasmius crinis-equi]|uniref:Uncharacterized protein n=1 Tax=Marasmius crinis-equi TaxID=585013 RepID=A0ABR3ET73_9AGAR